MMRRRAAVGRGRPGLVGTVARTAVVAGTATATAGAVNRRQANKAMGQQQEYQSQQQMADMQQQLADIQTQQTYAAMQPPTTAAPAGGGDLMQQLESLSSMKSQGLLTDEEFTAAKAKLLGT
jgi:hypothetical protein